MAAQMHTSFAEVFTTSSTGTRLPVIELSAAAVRTHSFVLMVANVVDDLTPKAANTVSALMKR